jgi:FAD/FMN-containing dehydrogenase
MEMVGLGLTLSTLGVGLTAPTIGTTSDYLTDLTINTVDGYPATYQVRVLPSK